MDLGVAGVDHPEEKAVVDIVVPGRGEMLMSWVEVVSDEGIEVTVPQNRAGQPVRLDAGERLDLVWKGTEGLRALPVELTATALGEKPTWRLRAVGPATRGQRRGAVRSPLQITLQVTAGKVEFAGTTVDVSESGVRAVLDPSETPTGIPMTDQPAAQVEPTVDGGAPATRTPEVIRAGNLVQVGMKLDAGLVEATAEIIRLHDREDGRPEISARFVGLSEFEQDTIRAHVFAQLRELRRRGVL